MTTTLETWTLVAETLEWVGPLTVTINGTPVTTYEVSVTALGGRPTTWEAATADPDGGASKGVLVGTGTSWTLSAGTKYTIYVRFTDSPETPVERAGLIRAI